MRAIKPIRLGFLHRVLELGRKPHLVVSVFSMTPFSGEKEIFTDVAMWKMAAERVGPPGILDECFSKPRGELLVFGSFHAPHHKAVPISYVSLQMKRGAETLADKKIAVFGDRVWGASVPSEPFPMETMPIDLAHAFGGIGFAPNQLGRGMPLEDPDAPRPLPNLEDPRRLIRAPDDRPQPMGLGPIDALSSIRMKKAGTYGSDYLETRFPGPAADMDPTYFNVAPEDQWLDGFFQGDESFVVENMHPEKPRLEAKLPSLVARAFMERMKKSGELAFEEIPLRTDTVMLFPAERRVVSVHRGMVPIDDADADDVKTLLLCAEDRSIRRTPEHYRSVLAVRSERTAKAALLTLKDEELMPQREAGWGDVRLPIDDSFEMAKTDDLIQKRAQKRIEARREAGREGLRQAGYDPDAYLPEPPAEDPLPDLQDIDAMLALSEKLLARAEDEQKAAEVRQEELEAAGREEYARLGRDWDADQEAARREASGPPTFRAATELARLESMATLGRNAGMPLADLEAMLLSPHLRQDLDAQEKALVDGYRESAAFTPAAAKLDREAALSARERVTRARDAGESLRAADLTGADLSGMELSKVDLEGAFLEGADLSGSILDGANLTRAVLVRAKLTGARFIGAELASASLGDTTFDGVDFSGAHLEGATFYRARLEDVSFRGAKLTSAVFFESKPGKVDFERASLEKVSFVGLDLRGARFAFADLEGAQLIECDLTGCDLSGAKLDSTVWADTKLDRAVLRGASMRRAALAKGMTLDEADLSGITLEPGMLRGAKLRRANLERANVSGADLGAADLEGANLDGIQAVGTMLMRANLTRASLVGANLMTAILNDASLMGANLSRANLFRASLSRVKGDDATRFTGANLELALTEPKAAGTAGFKLTDTHATEPDE